MDQIIKTDCVDFKALVSKNSNISLNVQTKMITELDKTFTEEESRWYIANFYVYMNYHPTNDFPINLENVLKMMGFAHKKNAKRTLENNFTENEDYKIVLLRTEQNLNVDSNKNLGGRPEETIMLNIDTFKNLCMMIKTDQGKAIRKYYVKLENIYNQIIKEEIEEKQKQLQEKDRELELTKKQLESKSKLIVKKWFNCKPGDMVYALKSNNLIKIGKTKNIKDREAKHLCSNQSGEIIYAKRCFDCSLTERVLHHVLDKHRVESNMEWFDISEELAKYIIDTVCYTLDNFVDCSECLLQTELNKHLIDVTKSIKTIDDDDDRLNFAKKEMDTSDINVNIDQKNYNKFLQEFFEYREDYYCVQYDVINAYRIWSRGDVNQKTKHEISTFMKSKFEYKDRYLEECQGRVQVYIGLQLKPLHYNPDNKTSLKSYEKFFLENCHVGYTFRIKITDFINSYVKWLDNGIEKLDKNEEIELRAYFNKKFLVGRVDKNTEGWWGFQFKTDALPKYGICFRRRKHVLQIDAVSKNIVEEYDSLMMASIKLNMCYKTLSEKVKFQRSIETSNGNFILQYAEN